MIAGPLMAKIQMDSMSLKDIYDKCVLLRYDEKRLKMDRVTLAVTALGMAQHGFKVGFVMNLDIGLLMSFLFYGTTPLYTP